MTVAPLTPQRAFARAGLGNLRPDRSVSAIALAPMQRGFVIGVGGLILTACAWVGWWAWRNWRASAEPPFAVALREMRGLDDAAPQGWHALHRAFEGTAGRALQVQTLPQLFQRAPHLQPQRPPHERFFSQSAARFFGEQPPGATISCRLCVASCGESSGFES
jgi:mxaA protein